MPWNWQRYPDAMKNLPVRVRHKAIEIANALLSEQYDEGRAIAIAISQAREWVENNPPRQRKNKARPTKMRMNGQSDKDNKQQTA